MLACLLHLPTHPLEGRQAWPALVERGRVSIGTLHLVENALLASSEGIDEPMCGVNA